MEDDRYDFVFFAPMSQNMTYEKQIEKLVKQFWKEYEEILPKLSIQPISQSRFLRNHVSCSERIDRIKLRLEVCGHGVSDIGTNRS